MERWHFLISLLGPGVGLTVLLVKRWWDPRRRAQRLMRRLQEKPIAALVDGEHAHVSGVAANLNKTLTSPIDQRVCLGFRSMIERKSEARPGRQFDEWIEACLSGCLTKPA